MHKSLTLDASGLVAYACNFSTWKVEERGSVVQGQLWIYSELKTNLDISKSKSKNQESLLNILVIEVYGLSGISIL